MYNRKRADESDAAASKQGDTASPEKRNAGLFRFFRRYYDCYAVRSVRRNFISFLRKRRERGSAKKRVPLPLQSASPGERGQGRFRKNVENARLFHNMRTEKTTGLSAGGFVITWCRRYGRRHRPDRERCRHARSASRHRQPCRYPHRDVPR